MVTIGPCSLPLLLPLSFCCLPLLSLHTTGLSASIPSSAYCTDTVNWTLSTASRSLSRLSGGTVELTNLATSLKHLSRILTWLQGPSRYAFMTLAISSTLAAKSAG